MRGSVLRLTPRKIDTEDMLKDAVDNPESSIISIEKDIRMEEFGVCLPSNRRRLHRRRPRLHPLMGPFALTAAPDARRVTPDPAFPE